MCGTSLAELVTWIRESADESSIIDATKPTQAFILMSDDRMITFFPLRFKRPEIEEAYDSAVFRIMAPRFFLQGLLMIFSGVILQTIIVFNFIFDRKEYGKVLTGIGSLSNAHLIIAGFLYMILARREACWRYMECSYVMSCSLFLTYWTILVSYYHVFTSTSFTTSRELFLRTRDFILSLCIPLALLKIREKTSVVLQGMVVASSLSSAVWMFGKMKGQDPNDVAIDAVVLVFFLVSALLILRSGEYAHRLLFIRLYTTTCRLLMTMRTLHDSRSMGASQVNELARLVSGLQDDIPKLGRLTRSGSEGAELGETDGSSSSSVGSRSIDGKRREDDEETEGKGVGVRWHPAGLLGRQGKGKTATTDDALRKEQREALMQQISRRLHHCSSILGDFRVGLNETNGEEKPLWGEATSEDRSIIQAFIGKKNLSTVHFARIDEEHRISQNEGDTSICESWDSERSEGSATPRANDSLRGQQQNPDNPLDSGSGCVNDEVVDEEEEATNGDDVLCFEEDRFVLQPVRPPPPRSERRGGYPKSPRMVGGGGKGILRGSPVR